MEVAPCPPSIQTLPCAFLFLLISIKHHLLSGGTSNLNPYWPRSLLLGHLGRASTSKMFITSTSVAASVIGENLAVLGQMCVVTTSMTSTSMRVQTILILRTSAGNVTLLFTDVTERKREDPWNARLWTLFNIMPLDSTVEAKAAYSLGLAFSLRTVTDSVPPSSTQVTLRVRVFSQAILLALDLDLSSTRLQLVEYTHSATCILEVVLW
jgi:hypothetical protein